MESKLGNMEIDYCIVFVLFYVMAVLLGVILYRTERRVDKLETKVGGAPKENGE